MASNLTDHDEAWDTVVSVPDDGDEYVAASVYTAFQVLANRTAFLKRVYGAIETTAKRWTAVNRFDLDLGLDGAANEVAYQTSDGTATTRERTLMLPITDLRPVTYDGSDSALAGQPSWRLYRTPADVGIAERYEWRPAAADYPLVGLYRLPSGSALKSVMCDLSVVAGASVSMRAGVYGGSPLSTANQGTSVVVAGAFNSTQTLSCPQVSWNGATRLLRVDFRFSTTGPGAVFAAIRSLYAVIGDPGPRNF